MKVVTLLMCSIAGLAHSADWGQLIVAGTEAFDSGRLPDAQRFYEAALQNAEAAGARDNRLAQSLRGLGSVLTTAGACEDGSRLLLRTLQIMDGLPDATAEEKAAAWQNLGAAYFCRHLISQAEHAYREALRMEASAPNPTTSVQVAILSGLGAIYEWQERFGEATAVLERARILSVDGDARTTVLLLNNLGTLHALTHHYGEAESTLHAAIDILEESTPRDETATARVMANLAMIAARRQRYSLAVTIFGRKMESIERGTALAPTELVSIFQGYATCLRKSGQKSEARRMSSRAARLLRTQPRQDPAAWLVSSTDLAHGR